MKAQATADLVGRLAFLDMLNARERAVLARLEADLTMSWILTESGFVFALSFLSRFLVAGDGVE